MSSEALPHEKKLGIQGILKPQDQVILTNGAPLFITVIPKASDVVINKKVYQIETCLLCKTIYSISHVCLVKKLVYVFKS